jgi:8-oxo-dGTP pyrophosphatase MutT (NUDIX family)
MNTTQNTLINVNPVEDLFYLGVKIFLKNSKNEILLLQLQKKDRSFWELPGGRVQKNETQEYALIRELQEETGITHLKQVQHLGMFRSKFRMQAVHDLNVGLIFSMFEGETDQIQVSLSGDHVAYQWASQEQAEKLLAGAYGDFKI